MTFATWIDTFTAEKGLDLEHILEATGPMGVNLIPLGALIDQMKQAHPDDQKKIKAAVVRLDFANAPMMPFFNHMAQAIAL
ncbi:hypothetical protein ACGYK5_17780 [Sulfitobacter sp. 1A16787]|uniref:hypothetical protein n=1 Tax=Sulfitobacter sp. 1A16787 TaxID=3368571 RepID=UPI0037465CAE